MLTKITSIESFDRLLEEKPYFYFMKHSDTCPISMQALDEFQKFHYERDIDGYYLIVRDQRELSNYIAEKFNIKHESPQAFYFADGKVIWHDSHGKITVQALGSVED